MARKKAQPDVAKKDYSQSERRRLAREGKALPSGAYPIADTEDLHNAAVLARSGHGDVEAARRLIARRAKELGVANPLESSEKAAMGNAFAPGGRDLSGARVSPPLTAGHQSPSSGDHGAGIDPMNMPGPRELAFRHPDLRQGSTAIVPWQALSTRNPDKPEGDLIFGRGRVNVDQLHQAETQRFTSQPSGNPNLRNYSPHSARGSATGPNGGHSLSSPQSNAVKSSEAREILKRHMFPQGRRG